MTVKVLSNSEARLLPRRREEYIYRSEYPTTSSLTTWSLRMWKEGDIQSWLMI